VRAEKVTAVVITHRPSLIAHADKVLVLEAGRVKLFGPADEVMKSMQKQAIASIGPRVAAAS
jgi:ABC-type protease/lipase transport system fused ATPase/permease subunit